MESSNVPPSSSGATEHFVRLLLANHRRLYRFILALVPSRTDADDVLQETSMVLWRKFDEFVPGTDFAAWAMKIARYEVLKSRDKSRFRFCLSEAALEALTRDESAVAPDDDRRHDALMRCLEKLPPPSREMIRLRYEHSTPVTDIAARMRLSLASAYRALSSIHERLLACIERTLAAEGGM